MLPDCQWHNDFENKKQNRDSENYQTHPESYSNDVPGISMLIVPGCVVPNFDFGGFMV